ncbi:MAG TPA: hypothetical protein DDW49_11765 [Deltaproteobacteria bacterium]|nr:MAG: hypothetical protein A2048_02590 [Deltaproteobacteria bacterium GWA2_45_12]HBF14043.1 hypothetical protein [Deltaproteobacteria bacterium]
MNVQNPNPNPTTPNKKFPTWAKVLIGLFVVFVFMLVLMGVAFNMCAHYLTHGGAEKVLEKGFEKIIETQAKKEGKDLGDVNIDFDKEGFSISDKKTGEVFSIQAGKKIPDSFPKEIPIFSPSTIVSTVVMGPSQIVVFETSGSFGEVFSFYQNSLPQKGWTKMFDMNPDEQTSSAAYQKEQEMLHVSVSSENNKVMLTLNHSKMN